MDNSDRTGARRSALQRFRSSVAIRMAQLATWASKKAGRGAGGMIGGLVGGAIDPQLLASLGAGKGGQKRPTVLVTGTNLSLIHI